jgi:hypothetical protein
VPIEPLDGATAKKVIRVALAAGRTSITGHFKEKLKEREISMQDVIAALKSGVLVRHERNVKTGDWQYTIEGRSIDSDPIRVVVIIFPDENRIRLITVFSE